MGACFAAVDWSKVFVPDTLIAEAAQNAMASNYNSLTDGLLPVATIVVWSYALDWLGYHVAWVGRFIHPPPLQLVRDGKPLWRTMRHELVTLKEQKTQLREQGIGKVEEVKSACMEGDGHIGVVKYDWEQHPAPQRTGV